MRDTILLALRSLRSVASRIALTLLLTLVASQLNAQTTPAFIQGSKSAPRASASVVAVPFANVQSAGDLNVVVVGWRDTNVDVQSVVDSNGNTYALAVGPTADPSVGTQSVYYAPNIAASTANIVTITFTGPAAWADIRIAEYSGVDAVAPVEAVAAAQGWNGLSDSGSLTTSSPNVLLVAANIVQSVITEVGPGFTARGLTAPSTNILEDRIVTPGTYNATASVTPGVAWIMQLVAFRAAQTVDTEAPTPPAGLTATSVSIGQIDLSWTPSTDNVGVTNYLIARCQDPGCTGFIQITTSGTGYSDSGLTPSTTYIYQVRATDAANNSSAYSNVATATTQTPPDTEPPTAPSGLTANDTSSTAVTLAWTNSTDNVGVVSYLIERCQGAGCTAFAQIATSASGYNDSGLAPSTIYKYRVRASDAANNLSAYSNIATATTQAPPDTEAPSAPSALAATAASGSTVNLAWTASTDNVGVSNYLIERCEGAGCTAFAQIATATTASFGDAGLTNGTTYRYRVRATDAAGNLSGYSNIATVTTTDTQAPSTPGSFSGTAPSSSQVSLTWTAATDNVGVAGYRVTRNGSLIATVTTLVYTDSGLTASTTYLYTVDAVDAAGNASTPASTTVTTQAVSSGPVVLASDDFNRANGGPGAGWTVIDSDPQIVAQHVQEPNTRDGNDSIAIYTGRTWPADQYSQVTVLAASLHQGASAVVRAKIDTVVEMYFVYVVGPLGPGAQVVLAKFVTHNYTELWRGVVPVSAGDTLFLGVQGTTLTVKLNGTTVITQSDGSIAQGYPGFDITDYDGQGNPGDGQLDNWSAGPVDGSGGTDTQAPSAPGSFSGSAPSSSQVLLTWTAATDNVGVTAYRVARNGSLIATVTALSYADSGLTASTTYLYTVVAIDAAGNASAPASTTVTTQAVSSGPVVLASDDFNRANGGPGAGWTVIDSDPQIVAQHVQEPNTRDGNDSIAIYTGRTWPADQYSQVTVLAASLHQGASAVVRAKIDTVVEMYFAYVVGPLGPGAQVVLAKFVTHNYTELWRGVVPVSAGDTLFLGVQGTTLTVKLNGTTVITQSDGSIAQGYPGFDITDYDGQGNPGDGQLDNWSAGPVDGSGGTDTQAPSAPGSFSGSAPSSSQVLLTWTAATDNVGVTAYRVARNGSLIATVTALSYADSGLTASTTYLYTVVAIDAAGNASTPASTTVTTQATADTQAPSTPGSFSGTAPSSSQVSLTWTAATDNVGVAGYRVTRNGSLIATVTTLVYTDSGLTASTTYLYTVDAVDAAGNVSAPASTTVTTQAVSSGPVVLASDDFNRANGGPGAGWTVIDSDPQIVAQHVQEPNTRDGNDSIAIYTGRTWPADQYSQVTVLAASLHQGASAVVRAKIDTVVEMYFAYVVGPLGPGAQVVLAKFVTHNYTELWRGVVPVSAGDTLFLGVQGTTLTVKLNGTTVITQSDGSIAQGYPGFDITDYDGQGNPGDGQLDNWSAGPVDGSGGTDTQAPSAPGSFSGSAPSSSQVLLTWTAATDNVGVTAYRVARNGSLIATVTALSYADSGLTASTTYLYTVVAIDAAGNASTPASTTVTTQATADTQAPSTPGSFSGTAPSSSQVSLTWTAATDNVGVAGYRVTRNGSLIATVTTLVYTDSGLTASTTYLYTVDAVDAAGNASAPASTTVTTQAVSSGPVVLASDDFNRANGGPGAGWTVIDSDPQIVAQHVQEPNTRDGNDSIAIYTGRTWPADQYSQVTVLAASLHQGASAVVRAKIDTVVEMYFVYVVGPLGPGAQVVLAKFVTHNYTELWRGVVPVSAGDTLFLGVQGTTLTVKLNGTTVITQSDGSIAQGYPGFDITDYDGQGNPGDGQLDNWSAGTIDGGGTFAAAGVPESTASRNGVSIATSASAVLVDDTQAPGSFSGSAYSQPFGLLPISPRHRSAGLDVGSGLDPGVFGVPAYDAAGNPSAATTAIKVTTLADTTERRC